MRVSKTYTSSLAYPLIHAHEIQHFVDAANGQLPVIVQKAGIFSRSVSVAPEVHLRTEARAYHRMMKVAQKLYSKNDLLVLSREISDEKLRVLVQMMADYHDNDPLTFTA